MPKKVGSVSHYGHYNSTQYQISQSALSPALSPKFLLTAASVGY